MKIITVLGARPQFIKAAVVSKCIAAETGIYEIIVHTGQHYDTKMSDVFFRELKMPTPKYNLGIGSASHGKQTARMLEGIEEIILDERPDVLMVYGDTNSTLAGALAASKLHVPVIHVEAGLRSYNKLMPEEQNRILTDHISDTLFCPTQTAINNLFKEGISKRAYNTGDVMYDSVLAYKAIAEKYYPFGQVIRHIEIYPRMEKNCAQKPCELESGKYYLTTIHRAENTDDIIKLQIILESLDCLDIPVVFLVHPRTIKMITESLSENDYDNIIFAEPVSYLEMLTLLSNARKVLTDSGGLQKEAYFSEIPCITLRDQTEWIETLDGNWNILSPIDKHSILGKVLDIIPETSILNKNYFGNGNAASRIVDIIRASY